MENQNDPWAAFPDATEDQWSDFEDEQTQPEMTDEGDRARAGQQLLGLPTPTPNMFADMDDTDAMTYYQAYMKSPDTQQDDQGNLVYRGVPVPKPEQDHSALERAAEMTFPTLSNVAGLVESITGAPMRQTNRDLITGGMGGLWNAGKNVGELAGAGIDYGINTITGDTEADVSNFVRDNVPSFNPQGTAEHIGEGAGEIGAGIVAGNKAAAVLKAYGMAAPAIAKIMQAAPKATALLTEILGSAAGVTATVNTNSDTLLVGPNSSWIGITDGIDASNPDEAKNILAKRLNIFIDNVITGGAAYGAGTIMKKIKDIGMEAIGKPLKRTFFQSAREQGVYEEIFDQLKHITASTTPEQEQEVYDRVGQILSDPKNSKIFYDVGIQGVDNPDLALDTASTFAKGMDSNSELDKKIALKLREIRKKVIGDEGTLTLSKAEAPAEALKNLTSQTEAVFDDAANVPKGNIQTAAEAIQDEAIKTVEAGKETAKAKALESTELMDEMGNKTRDFLKDKRAIVDEAYAKIPKETPYDPSFDDLVSGMQLPKKLQKLIDESDGTFAYLNNKIKPEISAQMKKFYGSNSNPDMYDDLQLLYKNIDETQIERLSDVPSQVIENASGVKPRGDILQVTPDQLAKEKSMLKGPEASEAAKAAKQSFKENVLPYREGLTGDIEDIAKKAGPNSKIDLPEQTRKALKPVLNDPIGNKERYAQLEEVLNSKGPSNILFKFKNAKEEQKAAEELSTEIFNNRFREFFDKYVQGSKLPSGINSFADLIENPQGLDRIKNIRKLAKDKNLPVVDKALKAAYARVMDDVLFKGDVTQTGAQKIAKNAASAARDDALLKAGKEIFSDVPQWDEAMKSLIDVSQMIHQDNFIRASKRGDIDFIKREGSNAFQKLVRGTYGPLSKAGTRWNTVFSTVLKYIQPQEGVRQAYDMAMHDPKAFMQGWKMLREGTKEGPPTGRRIATALVYMGILNEGDRNAYVEEYNKINKVDDQTERSFGDTLTDKASEVERQVRKVFE